MENNIKVGSKLIVIELLHDEIVKKIIETLEDGYTVFFCGKERPPGDSNILFSVKDVKNILRYVDISKYKSCKWTLYSLPFIVSNKRFKEFKETIKTDKNSPFMSHGSLGVMEDYYNLTSYARYCGKNGPLYVEI
jgi:hypothetical protein